MQKLISIFEYVLQTSFEICRSLLLSQECFRYTYLYKSKVTHCVYLPNKLFLYFFLSYIANAWCLIWTKQQLLLLARVAIFVFELGLEIHQECSDNEDNDDEDHRNDNGRPRSSSFRQPPNLLRWLNFWNA